MGTLALLFKGSLLYFSLEDLLFQASPALTIFGDVIKCDKSQTLWMLTKMAYKRQGDCVRMYNAWAEV